MRRLLALAGGLLALAACTPVLGITAEITLPAALQATLTYPVQVAFETDVHVGASHTLCAAETEDRLIVLQDTVNECAAPFEVRAVLGPWTAPMTGCTETDGNGFAAVAETAVADAAGPAYEGSDDGSGRCRSADDTVGLTLEAITR